MSRKTRLILFSLFAALIVLAVALSGCGGDETKTATANACAGQPETIIPAPSGRPQLIYFFRDT